MEFTVAIDFTKSNLPFENAASLHHVAGENTSQYEIAIQAIAEICQYYNNSQLFYAYGFGARLPGDNRNKSLLLLLELASDIPKAYFVVTPVGIPSAKTWV
ncbi:unnamed protein product [Gongylonema pulchrum]|uniref:Copine C-terminal domain-containing protein n=1 Tax=Gongylonema pulchrum TaxID=637853 RepID=A0A3P6RSR3_9BILA|nr:unnamed protein product [Gongylonema pulchrum]